MGAKSLLLDGLIWRVGNGIRVWDDAWLRGNGAHIVPTPRSNSDPNLRVALTDFENYRWDEARIREVFVEEEQHLVMEIPLA